MITIELTAEEVAELVRVLESYLSDLRAEIVDTDLSTYKERLRSEKGTVVEALEKLKAALPAAEA